MISKSDLLAIVKHASKAQRGQVERTRFVNPKREWFVIVSVTIVMFFVMAGALFFQSQVLNATEPSTVTPAETVSYDEATAQALKSEFEERLQQQAMYETSVAQVKNEVDAGTSSSTAVIGSTTPATADSVGTTTVPVAEDSSVEEAATGDEVETAPDAPLRAE